MNNRLREAVHQYTYYVIIGIASLFALIFLPMLGSEVGLGFDVPDTAVGWIVFATTKAIVAFLNVLIFHSFKMQAKVNIKDNENYKKANEILSKVKTKEYNPRSPFKYQSQSYSKKGTTIFFSTAAATVALTQAIMTFDYVTMFTYLFTIIMGIVFGIMQMFRDEDYWTREYLDYAKIMEKEKSNDNNRQQDVQEPTGTGS